MIRKGLSVDGGIVVRGGKFIMTNPSYQLVISEAAGVGDAAFTVTEDGLAIIYTNALGFKNVTNHFKVGIGAAIDLGSGAGQFNQVAGWNGNFSRRLEVNGSGKPTGDLSAIRDAAVWGYGYQG